MAEKLKIDALDRKILDILQQNAALSTQEIAERVGLSANPCWRRIKQLEAAGVLVRRVALVDPDKVGLGATAFVMVRTGQHDRKWLADFARAVDMIPEIVECHRMSGDIDYMLKIVVADIAHYDRVYQRLITLVPGLSDVSSTFSMERMKQSTAINLSTLS